MVDPKFMIDIEKKHNRSGIFPYSIQKKMHGRTEKNFVIDQEKTAWLILKKSMQIQLGTICNPRLCHTFHLPSHFTRASKMVYMNSPTPTPAVSSSHTICFRPSYMRVLR